MAGDIGRGWRHRWARGRGDRRRSGIGREIALALAAAGARVVVLDRNPDTATDSDCSSRALAATVDGTAVAIVDGGVHHVLRPALVGTEHRVRLLSPSTRRPVPVTVAGPLCSGLDVLATGAVMAPPSVGDLVAVLDVGAYGFTESMPLFLSHPIPAEVIAREGRAELIRPRLEPVAWLDRQLVPELGGRVTG